MATSLLGFICRRRLWKLEARPRFIRATKDIS